MSIEKMLKGHDLFTSLNFDEVSHMSKFSAVREFKTGETIFEYNQPGTHVYILQEGLVYLQLPAVFPEFSLALSRVEKGDLFGISPLIESPLYTASAKCYADTKVLTIEAKPFRKLLESNSLVGLDVMNKVARIYFTRYIDLLKRLHEAVSQV